MEAKDIQKEFLNRVKDIFYRPVFETSYKEVAIQAISILGREYSLSVYADTAFRISLNYSFFSSEIQELFIFFSELHKKPYPFTDVIDLFDKKIRDGYLTCSAVERLVLAQQKELNKKEEERIEREEEIRAKYRNWR